MTNENVNKTSQRNAPVKPRYRWGWCLLIGLVLGGLIAGSAKDTAQANTIATMAFALSLLIGYCIYRARLSTWSQKQRVPRPPSGTTQNSDQKPELKLWIYLLIGLLFGPPGLLIVPLVGYLQPQTQT